VIDETFLTTEQVLEYLQVNLRTVYRMIVDLKMPGMDGLSVIREAKRLRADLHVVIITGHSTEASAIDAVNLGVDGYLTKPFRVNQVLEQAAKAMAAT
jgi:DNA-binding response OmpR family regulator